ncbi:MAG: hypothetical protein HY816_20080 [Candidatus Wallbacteria bacterium]|nr:hypothetical protein [Candidatus Wallbacteria bacterium]
MTRVRSNLHLLDDDSFRRVLGELAAARGVALEWPDWEPLGKAVDGEHGGWRDDPVLEELFRRARGDFGGWMQKVVHAVTAILGREPRLPLSSEDYQRIRAEMQRRRAALVFNVTGEIVDGEVKLSALKHLGLIEEWTRWPASAALYGVLRQRAGGQAPASSFTMWVKMEAAPPPLGPLERQALEMARRSAATYVSSIADDVGHSMEEVVLAAEKRAIQNRIATSIETRRGFSGTVSDLFWDLKSKGINRDFERVVRTEMQQAFHEGNVTAIREQEKDPDPLVYKLVRDEACRDCLRLWTEPDGAPRLYPLSELERNGPNNAGRKRAEWVATVGPSHPNCTDSPCQVYSPNVTPHLFDAIRERRQGR